jgi:hypothetical protein
MTIRIRKNWGIEFCLGDCFTPIGRLSDMLMFCLFYALAEDDVKASIQLSSRVMVLLSEVLFYCTVVVSAACPDLLEFYSLCCPD